MQVNESAAQINYNVSIGGGNLTARSSSSTTISSQVSISTRITTDSVTTEPHEQVSSPYFPINIDDIIYDPKLQCHSGHSGKSVDGIILVFRVPSLPHIVRCRKCGEIYSGI